MVLISSFHMETTRSLVMIYAYCIAVANCFIPVNISKCSRVFLNLFLYSFVCFFPNTGSRLASYCLRSLIHIRVPYLNTRISGLGIWLIMYQTFWSWFLFICTYCIGAVARSLYFVYRVSCACGYICCTSSFMWVVLL